MYFLTQVITPSHGDGSPELELYPVTVRILRHQSQQQQRTANQVTSFTGMMGGMGGMAVSKYYNLFESPPGPPDILSSNIYFLEK